MSWKLENDWLVTGPAYYHTSNGRTVWVAGTKETGYSFGIGNERVGRCTRLNEGFVKAGEILEVMREMDLELAAEGLPPTEEELRMWAEGSERRDEKLTKLRGHSGNYPSA